jgi:hypothetical protein
MSNFIYPRTIKIMRSSYIKTPADGLRQQEITVAQGIPASIQLKRNRSQTAISFQGPTNADDAMPTWKIFTQPGRLANGTILKGDKITDELGENYIVEGPYWNSLGYSLEARYYTP